MNDRYLYRAKRIDNGEWAEGLLTIMWGQFHIINLNDENTAYPIDPSTICQCAGSKDRNGKKIYEKNIVRDEDGSVGIVEFGVWNYYSIGFYIRWLSGNAKYYRNELGYWAPKVEIIGSTFDNLELLEVGG